MSLGPVTGLDAECRVDHVFLPCVDVDGGVSFEPNCTSSPELDWVQVSENESPKLKTPEESNPLKAIPLDAPALSRVLNNLALASEPGCDSLFKPDSGQPGSNHVTVKSAQLQCHPAAPPLVIAPDLFNPDSTDLLQTVITSHSPKKRSKKGRRKKKPQPLHDRSNKSVGNPHQSLLDVLSKHIQNATSTSVFECGDHPIVPTGNATYIEPYEPGLNQRATSSNETKNQVDANERDWIKLAQPTIRDEITGAMPIEDILVHLTNHGCEDVTHKLKIKSSSDYPVSNGGFGDVYRVGLQDGRQLAFKCVRLRVGTDAEGQKYLQRAAHELYVWSKCQHPNVMELTGVSQFRGQLAMVSPWVDNGDLKWFIGRYPKVDRCALCVQVADGVTYLHGRGIVHGDLKAANILVSQDRVVKITDFGNAALAEYSLQFTSNAGGCSVSPRWTAPEILEEKTKTTVVGDIFALGMTILEVITGASPYDGVKDVVVSTKILNRVHPARPEAHIPTGSKHADRLWSLLLSCWEYDSQDRPTALQVRNEMKKITPKGLKSVPHGFGR